MNPLHWSKKKQSKETGDRKRVIEKGTVPKSHASQLQERLALFSGLSDKEVNTLYSLSSIRKLSGDEVLIREGDVDPTVYVILEGKIKLVRNIPGGQEEIAVVGKGAWIGDFGLSGRTAHSNSAVSAGSSGVMALNREILGSLEHRTQLFFYKRLNSLTASKLSQLEEREGAIQQRNWKLVDSLIAWRAGSSLDYGKSETILGIVKKIPRLPLFINRLSAKLMDDESSAQEVADLIKEDPSLVADVLKTVNSPYYGFQQKVSDINSAVLFLGFQELYRIVVAEGVRRAMPSTPEFKTLHSQAVAISHIAFSLSKTMQVGVPVQMATIGLLHNIGRAVVALLKKKNPGLSIVIDAIDHTQMGALLLKEWNLPDGIWKTVGYQAYPEFAPPSKIPSEVLEPAAILYMAGRCFEVFNRKPESEMPLIFFDEYRRILNCRKAFLLDFAAKYALPELQRKRKNLPVFLGELVDRFQQ